VIDSAIHITGGVSLGGTVALSGYKHSAVLLTNAALLCQEKPTILSFVPHLKDLEILIKLAEMLDCKCQLSKEQLIVDASQLRFCRLPVNLLQAVHGTTYLVPVLLARMGRAPLFSPGGCRIGNRSIDHVVEILLRMGAVLDPYENQITAPQGLHGIEINLSNRYPYHERSGCTKTALLAGSLARGYTTISYPYLRREVYDLIAFLQQAGADITLEQDAILIQGCDSLKGVPYELPADFLEWSTLILAVASTGGGTITLRPVPPLADFRAELGTIVACGIKVILKDSYCYVYVPSVLNPVEVRCPPVISDLQPLIACALWRADGTSTILDNEWPERFGYVPGLQALGVRLKRAQNVLKIQGTSNLQAAFLQGPDLRATAGLLIAALGASGISQLCGVAHLERGYDNLLGKLRSLGATICC